MIHCVDECCMEILPSSIHRIIYKMYILCTESTYICEPLLSRENGHSYQARHPSSLFGSEILFVVERVLKCGRPRK